jgi:Ala-tRNA(Pro) deacylase
MAVVGRVREFLDGQGIKYTVISHFKAFTAQEVAALTHVHGKDVAKTVIIKFGDKLVMVVIPAHHHVVMETLAGALGGEPRLATEAEFGDSFPQCERGALPPLGNLYGLPVWVSEALTRDEEIVFSAGTHTDAIRMKYADFDRLVKPRIISCSQVAIGLPRAEPTG